MNEKILSASEIKDILDKRYKENKRKGCMERCEEDISIFYLLIGDYEAQREIEEWKP